MRVKIMNQKGYETQLAQKMSHLVIEMVDLCQTRQERTAKGLNLMLAEYKALRYFRQDKMLKIGELAKRMALSNSRLTRIIDGLESKGIIKRELSRTDRRVMEIRITAKGEKVANKLLETCVFIYQGIIDKLPRTESENIYKALEKLGSAMRDFDKK
jgi:DNA-binding MarR family transcriptional regulator